MRRARAPAAPLDRPPSTAAGGERAAAPSAPPSRVPRRAIADYNRRSIDKHLARRSRGAAARRRSCMRASHHVGQLARVTPRGRRSSRARLGHVIAALAAMHNSHARATAHSASRGATPPRDAATAVDASRRRAAGAVGRRSRGAAAAEGEIFAGRADPRTLVANRELAARSSGARHQRVVDTVQLDHRRAGRRRADDEFSLATEASPGADAAARAR